VFGQRRPCSVGDLRDQALQARVDPPDLADPHLLLRRGREIELRRRAEEGERASDGAVDLAQADAGRPGLGAPAVRELPRVGAAGADPEELANLRGLGLELPVGGCAALQRPQVLGTGIRLPEDPHAEECDPDQQDRDCEQREHELRAHLPGQAADDLDEAVVEARGAPR